MYELMITNNGNDTYTFDFSNIHDPQFGFDHQIDWDMKVWATDHLNAMSRNGDTVIILGVLDGTSFHRFTDDTIRRLASERKPVAYKTTKFLGRPQQHLLDAVDMIVTDHEKNHGPIQWQRRSDDFGGFRWSIVYPNGATVPLNSTLSGVVEWMMKPPAYKTTPLLIHPHPHFWTQK